MMLDPLFLADTIADAYAASDPNNPLKSMPESTREELALAIGHGSGVAMDGNRVYMLLRPLLQARIPQESRFRPTLIAGTMPTEQRDRRARTTQEVSALFRTAATKHGPKPDSWAIMVPIPSDSAALVPIAATVPWEPAAEYKRNERTIAWYDLVDIPVGHIMYQVAADGLVLLCQRIGVAHWVLLQGLDGTQDIVDLPLVLSNIANVSEIAPSTDPRTLLRQRRP